VPKSDGHLVERCVVASLAIIALIFGAMAAYAVAADNHSGGFTRYARVDRPDGTYRNMLVDDVSLAELRQGRPAETMTILMESFSGGSLTSVFVKRREGGRWTYGSVRPGEDLKAFRPGPSCATCHRAAGAGEGTFTRPMLEGFVKTGSVRQTFCDRSGRSPCSPDVYRQTSR
jgi:hypothetical protein